MEGYKFNHSAEDIDLQISQIKNFGKLVFTKEDCTDFDTNVIDVSQSTVNGYYLANGIMLVRFFLPLLKDYTNLRTIYGYGSTCCLIPEKYATMTPLLNTAVIQQSGVCVRAGLLHLYEPNIICFKASTNQSSYTFSANSTRIQGTIIYKLENDIKLED